MVVLECIGREKKLRFSAPKEIMKRKQHTQLTHRPELFEGLLEDEIINSTFEAHTAHMADFPILP